MITVIKTVTDSEPKLLDYVISVKMKQEEANDVDNKRDEITAAAICTFCMITL